MSGCLLEKFIKEKQIFQKMNPTSEITGYHYTNPQAYRSMGSNGINRGSIYGYDNFKGLIPINIFIKEKKNGLPDQAYDGVIEGLLEPEPQSWLENPEFPFLWGSLMHDIWREDKTMLLSFRLESKDEAYIVERAHVERELYKEAKGQGKPTEESKNEAFKKYWESRVPVFDYDGSYSVPQLTIWSGIEFERLNVEWVKATEKIWQRVLDNNW